jgi:hypothetical protein
MPRAIRASVALLATGLFAGRASAEPREGSDRFARVDSIIEAAIRDGATPGAALAIGRRGARR